MVEQADAVHEDVLLLLAGLVVALGNDGKVCSILHEPHLHPCSNAYAGCPHLTGVFALDRRPPASLGVMLLPPSPGLGDASLVSIEGDKNQLALAQRFRLLSGPVGSEHCQGR